MASSERLTFDIFANADRAVAGFAAAGKSAQATAGEVKKLADRLDLLKTKSATPKIGIDDIAAKAKIDALNLKLLRLGRKVTPDVTVEGVVKAAVELSALDAELDKLGRKNVTIGQSLQKIADKMKKGGGPWWLGPALVSLPAVTTLLGAATGAAIGLGGAFVAGGLAVAGFAAVAKPVLASALKAEQAVNVAQNAYQATVKAGVPTAAAQASLQAANARALLTYNAALAGGGNPAKALAAYHLALARNQVTYNAATNAGVYNARAYRAEQLAIGKAYADLSPQQIRLSQQLGKMAQAWQNVKASFTPLIAGSLQPWLAGVTTGIGLLGRVIRPMVPVVTALGTEFGILVGSPAFAAFARWVGTTGSAVAGSAGTAILNLITGIVTLLPKFTPLITGAANGISKWSLSFALWAGSQKASDQIKGFLKWFRDNGPLVKTLLLNLGGALKALAPGLTSGGALEIKILSGFLGWIAKLPPAFAKPLGEVAGSLLILNKLGVVSVGLKVLGIGGAGAAAGGAAASAGLWSKLLPGIRLVSGALLATVVVAMVLKGTSSGPGGKNWWDNPGGANPTSKDPSKQGVSTWVGLGHQIEHVWDIIWNNTAGAAIRGVGRLELITGGLLVKVPHIFDGIRHDVAHWWDLAWANTISRAVRGGHDIAVRFDGFRHRTAVVFDGIRGDIARYWSVTWANTIGRVQRGIAVAVSWFSGMPGRVIRAVGALAGALQLFGARVLTAFLNGVKSVWGTVTGWFSGLPKAILHALGIHSPPDWAISAGKHVMGGLLKGIAHGASDVRGFFTGLAGDVLGPLKNIWHDLFGGGGTPGAGVARWALPVSKALAMLSLPQNLMGEVLFQMQTESGGNPLAVNRTDQNWLAGHPSVGLMQVIAGTFQRYAGPFARTGPFEYGVSVDPFANIYAALNYGAHNGRGFGPGPGQIGSGHGYALGTSSAAPGWARVGEHGAEWVHFRGGEQVIPHRGGGGGAVKVVLEVRSSGHSDFDRFMATWIKKYVAVAGGGSPQVAFGTAG